MIPNDTEQWFRELPGELVQWATWWPRECRLVIETYRDRPGTPPLSTLEPPFNYYTREDVEYGLAYYT
jgi:hypothetical protein